MKLVRGTLVLLLLSTAAMPVLTPPARAEVIVTVAAPPPLLPVYDQPPLPDVGFIWVPGYWAYDDADGYFWVPGTWVRPPRIGLLWTPGYWAFDGGSYVFTPGYWADRIGYYGGIDYGFGYTGVGYQGGYWRGDRFFYNTAVTRITDVQVVNVYNETIVRTPGPARVSFNGGPGGIRLRPTPEQLAFMHERHIPATPRQIEHFRAARQDPDLRDRVNHGRPPLAATARPGQFGRGGERPPGPPRTVIGTPEQRPDEAPREERRREPRGGEMRPAERAERPDVVRPREMRPQVPASERGPQFDGPGPRPSAVGPRENGRAAGPRENERPAGPREGRREGGRPAGPREGAPNGPRPHPEAREHRDERR